MNLKGCARKRSWPNFKELSRNLPGRTEKNTKSLSQYSWYQGWDLNPGPPEYEAILSTTCPMWWPVLKNNPTVTHVCRKRRLKWVPSAWGYSWATLYPRVINTEAWSSRLGVGRWTNNPACKKAIVTKPHKGRPGPKFGCKDVWRWWVLTTQPRRSVSLMSTLSSYRNSVGELISKCTLPKLGGTRICRPS
jgi:hypothetical protein